MARLTAIDPAKATGKSKDLLGAVQKKLGATPNMMRTLAHSPAALNAYLAFSGALAEGSLSGKIREQIALAVSEVSGCEYCLAAHTAIGKGFGLSDKDVEAGRRGEASEPKAAAAVGLAVKITEGRGDVSEADLAQARKGGLTDGEIAEVVGNVALNLYTNYFNHVADPEIDFPRVPALAGA